MISWNQLPLFRLLIPFVAGILIEIFNPLKIEIVEIVFIIFILIVCLFTFLKSLSRKYKTRWIYGLSLNVAMIFLGVLLVFANTEKNNPHFFVNAGEAKEYIGVLDDQLHIKNNAFKTLMRIRSVKLKNNQWKDVSGNVLVYLSMDETSTSLKYGDAIIFSAVPREVELPKNPEEFNYKRFLTFHNVYHQVYLAKNKWSKLNFNDGNIWLKYSYDLRDKLVDIFRTKIIRSREVSVASALVLGYVDEIDAELINAYSSAGALHVLSVSGMHVGIIFIVFNGMLVWMDKNKWLRHLKFIILLSFIWFYAMLTGFSPSVLRSALMISFVIIGTWQNSNSNIYNTLIISVFLLLVYNPYLITEVGFQLSYFAVFGIVFINPMILRWYEPSGWFVHQVWQIISVSMSAQLMTFPLALLYFHQFPNLFFISNLVVIPLSTAIIYLCILLLFVASITGISFYLSVTCFGLLYTLNGVVLFVEQVPYSILKEISISVFETWIIYLSMSTAIFFILYKRPVYLQLTLLLFVILLAGQVEESIKIKNQKKFIVYDIPNESAYDFIGGKENYFIADSSLINDQSKMMFHILHNRWSLGIEQTQNITGEKNNLTTKNIFIKNNFIQFYSKKIFIARNKIQQLNTQMSEKIRVDYLIVAGKNYSEVKKLLSYFDIKLLIIDSSVSSWNAARIAKECKELKVNYYSVPDNGALVLDI